MIALSKLSYRQLTAACEAGGANTLTVSTELAPAGGPHAAIAPAPRIGGRGASPFHYETRLIDGEPAVTVLIDDNRSQLQRVEVAILHAIRDQHPVLGRVPHAQVSYDGGRLVYTDLELPQRIFDGHFLAGTVDGKPAAAHPLFRAARECSPDDARAVLEVSPGSLVFGAVDPPRSNGQNRFRGALSGEIIGVLVDQSGTPRESRGDDAGVVSCSRIMRTQVLSFAALRQLRFDCGPAGDEAGRALLAAYALAGLARANAELSLRANCDLVETAPTTLKLDARDGEFIELAALSPDDADELLEQALVDAYREADINWRGQVLNVVGNTLARAADREEAAGQVAKPVVIEARRFRLPHFLGGRRDAVRS